MSTNPPASEELLAKSLFHNLSEAHERGKGLLIEATWAGEPIHEFIPARSSRRLMVIETIKALSKKQCGERCIHKVCTTLLKLNG